MKEHKFWMHYLVAAGWMVSYFPVVVTHSSLVTSTACAALQRCGVTGGQAEAVVRAIVRSTLTYNVKIKRSRHSLYQQDAAAHPHQPP